MILFTQFSTIYGVNPTVKRYAVKEERGGYSLLILLSRRETLSV